MVRPRVYPSATHRREFASLKRLAHQPRVIGRLHHFNCGRTHVLRPLANERKRRRVPQ